MIISEIVQQLPAWLTQTKFFYHGTARSNLAFHPVAVSYWTTDYDEALDHAVNDRWDEGEIPFVIEARLDFRHPIQMETMKMQDLHIRHEYGAEVAQLVQQGYDLVFHEYPGEVCVIDPRIVHVVSATQVA
jgi:hypothetical protein